ncbi:Adenine specific DNA methylase Mod, partial [Metamycoplasma alkalescens]
MHKTCAYNAMFPIRVADFFIKKYTNKKDIVLDPFSGRGTTLLQARILNRISYASDLNPLSYVLSKSKEKNLDLEKIINRVNELKKKYYLVNDKEKYLKKINNLETMQIYYSDYNLKQISFLKEKIGKKW